MAPSKGCWIRENNYEEEHKPPTDLIHCESYLNFIQIHLLSYVTDHIRQFGNIPIDSTEFR